MLDVPATRRDLLEVKSELQDGFKRDLLETKAELRAELRLEFGARFDHIDRRLEQLRRDFNVDLARAINTALEAFTTHTRAFDDKYEARTTTLRHDLDTHVADETRHTKPRTSSRRRK